MANDDKPAVMDFNSLLNDVSDGGKETSSAINDIQKSQRRILSELQFNRDFYLACAKEIAPDLLDNEYDLNTLLQDTILRAIHNADIIADDHDIRFYILQEMMACANENDPNLYTYGQAPTFQIDKHNAEEAAIVMRAFLEHIIEAGIEYDPSHKDLPAADYTSLKPEETLPQNDGNDIANDFLDAILPGTDELADESHIPQERMMHIFRIQAALKHVEKTLEPHERILLHAMLNNMLSPDDIPEALLQKTGLEREDVLEIFHDLFEKLRDDKVLRNLHEDNDPDAPNP